MNNPYILVTKDEVKTYEDVARDWYSVSGIKRFTDCRSIAINVVTEFLANLDGKTIYKED